MNTYIIDSNSLIHLGGFFPSRFPSLWNHIEELVKQGRLISVKECRKEIDSYANDDYIKQWVKNHSGIFLPASPEESEFVGKIFSVPHFSQLISATAILKGKPVADPFLIAAAKIKKAILITEEELKPNAAKIPNICKHFAIDSLNLEQMMESEDLLF